MMKWYVLVRRNDPKTWDTEHLTKEEIERNEHLPILIHWDKDCLSKETNGYYIKEIEVNV